MRDGIAAKPENWRNCVMWVQDIVSPSVNITAEISKEDALNFIKLCQIFCSYTYSIDDK